MTSVRLGFVNGSDSLAQLFHLQDKDLELDRIKEEEDRLPEALVAARKRWAALQDELEGLQDRLQESRLEYNRNDLQHKDLTAKRSKAQESQRNAQSAREQTQYENVIQQFQGLIEELEEALLPLMAEIERLEGEVARVKGELEAERPRLEELENANEARIAKLEAAYQEKLAERNRMAAGIPANLVREYESIRKARKGTGVAKMLRAGSGYRCGACNVQLPMHVAQQVIQSGKVVRCPACGRILWKGE